MGVVTTYVLCIRLRSYTAASKAFTIIAVRNRKKALCQFYLIQVEPSRRQRKMGICANTFDELLEGHAREIKDPKLW